MTHHPLPQSIALHVGAHKTATTHLQQSLAAAKAELARHSASMFGPPKLRDKGQRLVDRFNLQVAGVSRRYHSGLEPAEQLKQMAEGAQRLILSDENFIGSLQTKSGDMDNRMYPRASGRIAALADATGVAALDVFLGIRNPATFLTSAYSQLLMAGDAIPFDVYRERNPLRSIYWPGLVVRIATLPQVRRLIVWRQEDYSQVFGQICNALVGAPCSIEPLQERVHTGLSDQAVKMAQDLFVRTGEQAAGKAARDVYPVNQIYEPFSPLDAQTIAQSDQDYQEQLADISSLPGVTVLRP